MSRAYYAIFHALLPFVSKLPPSSAHREHQLHITHEDLARRISEWRVESISPTLAKKRPFAAAVVKAVDTSRAFRERADYRLHVHVTLDEALQQIDRVDRVFRALEMIEAEITSSAANCAEERQAG